MENKEKVLVSESKGQISDTLEECVKKLYAFRDCYFEYHPIEEASMKHSRLQEKLENTILIFNENSEAAISENRARYFYLLGRAHDVIATHSALAEEALTKAVKLDPKLVHAWNQLGECYWKRDNIKDAKNCFQGALSQDKNKISLRNLSMLVRHETADSREEKIANVEQSLDLAKQAVEIDTNDGDSWSVLGNAHLSYFFAIQQNPKSLQHAMSAYLQAEKHSIAGHNPSLHYNKAVALKYEEDYKSALDAYSRSCQLDPTWEEPYTKQQQLISYLDNTVDLINNKGRLKAKKIQSLLKELNEKQLGPYEGGHYKSPGGQTVKLECRKLSQVKPGLNEEVVILGAVICSVRDDDSVPFTFCIMDSEKSVFAVTLYNLARGKGVIIGDIVAIPEPYVSFVNFSHGSKKYIFNSIRVGNPLVMVVNGKKVKKDKLASAELSTFKSAY
uniref:Tetratricopeptide repeat protein 5 OB fold domain-containing protein n=1 Tax=Clastoptera arizonana TaxID=38151 RepID=A0A1B6DEG0_9HEMI